MVSYILLDIFWDNFCFITSLFVVSLYSLWSQHSKYYHGQLSKYYHGHSLKNLSWNCYSGVFVFFLSVMPVDNMTWYTRIGGFQLTRFKSVPSHCLKSTLNSSIFTLSIWIFCSTFCNFFINLGLSVYDALSLLTYISIVKPSWIVSPKLITVFLLFIHISSAGQLREGLLQLLIVCSGDIEVNQEPKIRSEL